MDSSEVMSIEIDVGEGIKNIEDIGKALKEIKNASQELSKSIASAFTSLNQNLSAQQSSLNALTGAANQAAEALKGISLSAATEGISEEASALGETVGMLFGTTLAAATSVDMEKAISAVIPLILKFMGHGGGKIPGEVFRGQFHMRRAETVGQVIIIQRKLSKLRIVDGNGTVPSRQEMRFQHFRGRGEYFGCFPRGAENGLAHMSVVKTGIIAMVRGGKVEAVSGAAQ